MSTTNYTFDKLYGAGTSSIDLTAETSYTFDITNNSGSSYFVMETNVNQNGVFGPNSPKNTSGSYTSLTNIASIVTGDYITGFALPTGTNSFIFTPAINVTGSTLRLRGTGGITLALSSNSSFDPDAQAFITAASITDPTQQSAINALVIGMKADNLWDKMKAIYPFVGGTAFTHKFNLKDPRDLDAAFRLAFNGGWTHSSNGALPNGTNGFANTFLNPKTILNVNSNSFGIYSRTQDVSIPAKLYGCSTGSNYLQNNVSVGDFISGTISNQLLYTPSPTTGLILASRTTSTLFKAFRNNILLGSKTTNVVDIPTANFYFGARNENNITQASYNPYQHAFAFLGNGLTDTEASNLYTRVQAFQTTLNRQV